MISALTFKANVRRFALSIYNLFIFRHYGDLGNVVVQGGKATVGNANQNAFVRLTGENNVIGKSIVVRIPYTFKLNSHWAKVKAKTENFRDVCRLFFYPFLFVLWSFSFALTLSLGLNRSLQVSHLNEINWTDTDIITNNKLFSQKSMCL